VCDLYARDEGVGVVVRFLVVDRLERDTDSYGEKDRVGVGEYMYGVWGCRCWGWGV
jgi:hypothetical protein